MLGHGMLLIEVQDAGKMKAMIYTHITIFHCHLSKMIATGAQ